eukprot:765630-Hanusia_phi.AAC.5
MVLAALTDWENWKTMKLVDDVSEFLASESCFELIVRFCPRRKTLCFWTSQLVLRWILMYVFAANRILVALFFVAVLANNLKPFDVDVSCPVRMSPESKPFPLTVRTGQVLS